MTWAPCPQGVRTRGKNSTKRQFITGSLSGVLVVVEDSASSTEGDLPTVAI